jgi:cellulose synthase/poly-beta-1,6-N-acetylglucosamine synthase-like glycosyltransferase
MPQRPTKNKVETPTSPVLIFHGTGPRVLHLLTFMLLLPLLTTTMMMMMMIIIIITAQSFRSYIQYQFSAVFIKSLFCQQFGQ